jgi:hypothetical protein
MFWFIEGVVMFIYLNCQLTIFFFFRYILAWREKFRKGEELMEFKRGKKSWGGERRRKAVKAEFLAQQFRKAHHERLAAEKAAQQ